MKYLKKFEDIVIPIKVGDTILGGRFKNKRLRVKKIGKNAKGDITINDKITSFTRGELDAIKALVKKIDKL